MSTNEIAGFRLSLQQERAWRQLGDSPNALTSAVWRVTGPVDAARLRAALCAVMQDHEILRTQLHRKPGMAIPFQLIQPQPALDWQPGALSPLSVQNGPTLQARLVAGDQNSHTLTLRAPALLLDPRSMQLLGAELMRRYDTVGATEPAEVLQYADFVEWQSELLTGADSKAGRDYWRERVRVLDFSTTTLLPGEGQPESEQFLPAVVTARLNDPDRLRLEATATQHGTSVEAVLCASWVQMLTRLLGRSDLVVGVEDDGRKFAELGDALGMFSRSLPLQFSNGATGPFTAHVKHVATGIGAARAWSECFSWSLLEATGGSATAALSFQFSHTDLGDTQRCGELSLDLVQLDASAEPFTLKLEAQRSAQGMTLHFHYDAARLGAESVQRWAGHYQTLLAAALADPQTLVSRLPLLNDAERTQQLLQWNDTSAAYPQQCLHPLFEAQAARTPQRLALRVGEQTLTYQQLNERANQLAHHLRTLGVGPDALVGLAVERSVDMMVAMLGILKAGGAYVPLNPDNPTPRLAQQLGSARVLLTETALLSRLPAFAGPTLCLDRDAASWSNQPTANPALNTTPEQLVYVLYTSGSTGVPKGVAVRHRNLVNYAYCITQRLTLEQFPDGLHFATVSTIGADLGNTCIFPALISGGCLHVISYEDSTDSQRFVRYAQQYPLDVLKIVPSHLQALLGAAEARQLLPNRFLILGGESFTPALLEQITALAPRCAIFNHYGPTETTVGSLMHALHADDRTRYPTTSLPIGRPLANTQLYVLDEHLQPLPLGVAGELYIAGDGVTAGYLNQPEKTAERFLPNPFGTNSAARMYRTGDLVRYWPDGAIEFLGRSDDQVKIRGFRIELGEIESILCQHPAVKQALVMARPDAGGEQRLVAYLVLTGSVTEQLRDYLKQQLPDYMVPAVMISLPRFPLTPNGKIDRAALPAPDHAHTQQTVYVAPTTPTQEVVAEIWAQVLRRDRVSIHDNFFDLGGHSLMATQIVSRIRAHFEVELPMRVIFEQPTIEGVAVAVAAARQSGKTSSSAISAAPRAAYRTNQK